MTIIALNASSQGFNVSGDWNEAVGTNDIAERVVRLGNKQGLDIRSYWGGNQKTGSGNLAGLRDAIARAKRDGVKLFLSFHTDSAGNKNNDGRGYTGSLMLYRTSEGKHFGETITKKACAVANVPFYASRLRTDLMVLKNFSTAALIEIMNHSDPDDRRLLLNPDWREQYAKGLVNGICEYLKVNYQEQDIEEDDNMSFQAIPTIEDREDGRHFWYDGLSTGDLGKLGIARVFMTVRLDKDGVAGSYKYVIAAKDKKRTISWSFWTPIEKDNRPVEVEFPQDIGNFSLHLVVGPIAGDPRVSVNQVYLR